VRSSGTGNIRPYFNSYFGEGYEPLREGEAVKVIFHKQFYEVYAGDPAAASGRMEAMVRVLDGELV
jgi:hypothetical protein